MNNTKKPEPIFFPRVQKTCAVCGKVSYSLSGEHPQCAQVRSDGVARAKLKKRNAAKAVAAEAAAARK